MAKLIDDTKKNASNSLVKNVGNKVKESVKEAKTQKEQKTVQKPSTKPSTVNTRQESRNDNPIGAQSLVKAQKRYVDVKEDLTQKYRNNEIDLNDDRLQTIFKTEASKNKSPYANDRQKVYFEQQKFEEANKVDRAVDFRNKDTEDLYKEFGEDRVKNIALNKIDYDSEIQDIDAKMSELNDFLQSSNDMNANIEGTKQLRELGEQKKKLTEDRDIRDRFYRNMNDLEYLEYGSDREKSDVADVVNARTDSIGERIVKGTGANALGIIQSGFALFDTIKDVYYEGKADELTQKAIEDLQNGTISQDTYEAMLKNAQDFRDFTVNDERNVSQQLRREINQMNMEIQEGLSTPEKFAVDSINGTTNFLMQYALFNMIGATAGLGSAAAAQVGETGSLLSMSAQSGTQKYYELIDEGYDPNTAFLNAATTGLISYMTEKIGMDNFVAVMSGKAGQSAFGQIVNSISKGGLKNYYAQSIASGFMAEGLEEVVEGLVDPIADAVTLGKPIEYNVGDLFYSFLVGGMSGALMSGAGAIQGSRFVVNTKAQYNALSNDLNVMREIRNDVTTEYANAQDEAEAKKIKRELDTIDHYIGMGESALNGFDEKSVVSKGIETAKDQVETTTKADGDMSLGEAVYPEAVDKSQEIKARNDKMVEAMMNIRGISQEWLLNSGIDVDVDAYMLADAETRADYKTLNKFANDNDTKLKIREMFPGQNGMNVNNDDGTHAGIIVNTNQKTTLDIDKVADVDEVDFTKEHGNDLFYKAGAKSGPITTAIHELTHFLEKTGDWAKIRNFVESSMGKERFAKAVKRIGELYSARNIKNANPEAETVAFYVQKYLGNEKFVNSLTRYNTSIASRLFNDLKATVSGDTMTQLESTFRKAFREAQIQTRIEAREAAKKKAETKIGENTVSKDKVELSVAQWDTTGREILKTYLENNTDIGESQEILDRVEEMYDRIKEFMDTGKFPEFSKWQNTYYAVNEKGDLSVVINNGEYELNIDFSTVCKKRKMMDKVLNELSRNGYLNGALKPEQLATLRQTIQDHGMEVACGLCFVDSKRFNQGKWAGRFMDKWNGLIDQLVGALEVDPDTVNTFDFVHGNSDGSVALADIDFDNPKLKSFKELAKGGSEEAKMAKAIMNDPSLRSYMSTNDMYGSEGLEAIKSTKPELYKLVNASGGASKPKLAHGEINYRNEILFNNKFNEEEARKVGGVRVQSFSDFMTNMVFDYVQMFADMEAKNLPGHSYTKVKEYALLYGKTGMKINLSIIPAAFDSNQYTAEQIADIKKNDKKLYNQLRENAGLDANGNYVFDPESFDFDLAIEIQNLPGYDKNVGTICVGVSDKHIEKLLNDPNVCMVIPYHRSGLSGEIAKQMGISLYNDYTNKQNTRFTKGNGKPGTKVGKQFDFDFYNGSDVNGVHYKGMIENGYDAKATADSYLAWCSENNYTPKFDTFKDNPNYYKLLIDFRAYDKNGNIAPQESIKVSGENSFANANDVIDPKKFPKLAELYGGNISFNNVLENGLRDFEEINAKQNEELGKITSEVIQKLGLKKNDTGSFSVSLDGDSKRQYSLSLDQDYDKAVESGDMDTAQRMVEDEAKKWGAWSENGKPVELYHGTPSFGFTEFDMDKMDDGQSIFLTNKTDTAKTYSGSEKLQDIGNRKELSKYDDLNSRADYLSRNDKDGATWEYMSAAKIFEMSDELETELRKWFKDSGVARMKRDLAYYYKSDPDAFSFFDAVLFEAQYSTKIRNLDGLSELEKKYEKWKKIQELIDPYNLPGTGVFLRITPSVDGSPANYTVYNLNEADDISGDLGLPQNRAIYSLYAKLDNPLIINCGGNNYNQINIPREYREEFNETVGNLRYANERANTREVSYYAKTKGYDGVIFKRLKDNGGRMRTNDATSDVYVVFDPNNVKSADPVTYDDDGNVIPLSERFNSRSNDIRYSLTLDDDNYGLHYGSPNLDPNYKSETLWQRSGRGTGAFGTGTYFFGKNGENIQRYSQGRTEHKVDFSNYNLYKPSNSEDAYRLHSLFKELDDNYSYTGATSVQEYKQKVSDIINDLELESKINEDGTYEDVLLSPEEEEDVKNRLMELGDSEEYVDELLDENRDENGRVLADYLGDELRSRYIEENYWSKRPRSLDRAEDYEAMVSHVPELAELLGEDEDYMYDVVNEAIRSAESDRYRRDFMEGNYDSVGTRVMKKLGYEGIDVRDLKGLDNSTFGSVIYDLKPSTIRYSLGLDDARKKADDNNLRNDYGIFYANIFGNRDVKISEDSDAAVYNALNEAYENGTVSEETRRDLRRAILEETKEEIPVDTPYNGEEMRKYLRSHKISINSLMNTALRDDKHSSGGYGDFGQSSDWRDYMRSHAKYYNFRREGGTDVDKVFQEFAELYPSSVDPNLSGAKDQLDAMVEAVENNMPRSETRYATQYGEEQFDEWVDEKINKMVEDVQKTKEFREKMDSGELKVTDEDLDRLVRRNPINARTMKALEENERIFRENAKSWIPDYDIIREKYDVFSEDVLNDAMYETLMYGHAEPETIQAMTKELVDRLDNVDWRIAESLTNDVNEAVEDMLHYFALDFQYKANQKNIDPVVTRVNNVVKAFDEATDIDAEIDMQKEIVDSLKEAEAFKKSQGDTDLAAMLIQRGEDQKTYTWRTLEQNLDYVANGDMELRDRLRVDLELPRSVAQLRRNEIRNEAQKIIDKAKDLGITAGSDESKIAQFYKEGHTNERDTIDTSTQEGIDRKRSNPWKEYTKEQFDTDTDYKMKNGKTAKENIKEVVRMIDDSYNSLILALNMSQTEIYGDVIGQNEYETAQLKAKLERQSKTVEILKEEMKKNDSVEKQGAYNKAVKEYNKLINQLNTKLENDASNDSTRRRFTPLRRNYAHHITKSSLVNDIKGIIKGRDAIPTALNGLSENTLPNTASAGFMWAQEGGDYIPDLIESYANYVDEASKVLAYNDYIVKLRQITKDLRATATGNEMSRFTDYLEQYANDIAGKRRAIDRAVDKAMPSVGQAIRVANRLGKRAALMFNVNSALVQVANIPNGLGILRRQGGKSYGMDVVKGISDMLNSNREDMKSIMEKSAFMNDRYFDFNTYDNSLKAKIGDLADGMMTIGDKFGANVIWWSAYEQALRKGMTPGGSSAIFYADDITRRTTAGRGVGEVPLGLRSNVLNTIAPFQVENNNSWQTFKQNVKGKQLGALVTAGVFSYLLNMLFRFLKRDDVLPEALSPIVDQLTSDATVEEKLTNIVKGELGELLSALPGGSFLTSLSMGKDKADELFGDYNPSRYGITNIGLTGLGNAIYDAGVKNDGLAALTDLFEGYFPGGKQISRTIEGLQSYGVVPQYNDESGKGMLDLNNWSRSAKDYNSKGQIKFENDPDDIWGMIQAALFGKWASKSAQEYVDNGFKAYGNTATNISKLLDEMGQSTYTKMFSGNVTGENSQKFVDRLKDMGIYDEYLDKVHEKYNEYLDTVPDGEKPDTFNKFANSYGLTKAVMDGTYEPKESVQTEAEPQKEESGFDFFSFLRNEKDSADEKESAEEKEETQNKKQNLQNNVYSNYSSSRKMDEKKAKTFQSAMDLDGLYKDAKGNVSDNNSTGAKKVRNSEAIETRKALEDMGEYESVLDYIAQNGLDYSDFGLTKTVVGWNDSKFDSEYAEMFGGDNATKTSYRSTGSRRSGSRRSSSTASSDLARHSSAVLSRSKNNRYSSTMSLLTQLQNARRKNSTQKSYKDYMKKRG